MISLFYAENSTFFTWGIVTITSLNWNTLILYHANQQRILKINIPKLYIKRNHFLHKIPAQF